MLYMPIPEKQCTGCKQWFPATLEYFRQGAKFKCGVRPLCRPCQRADDARYRAEYRDRIRERNCRWKDEHHDQVLASLRRYDAEHREERREYYRRYQNDHADRIVAKGRRYRAENLEVVRARARKWSAEHKGSARAAKLRRRAREKQLPDTFTNTQALAALYYWQWECAYCGVSLAQFGLFEDVCMHFDHFIPLSDPRPDNPGTTVGNMLPTCGQCNWSKNDSEPMNWLAWKFGARKAKRIAKRVAEYFEAVKARH